MKKKVILEDFARETPSAFLKDALRVQPWDESAFSM